MESFKTLYEQGKATRDMLDDLVDKWHNDPHTSLSLVDYLGFETIDDYDSMIKDPHLK